MKNLRSRYFCKFLTLLFVMCLTIQPLSIAQAANHTNSMIKNVYILNLTANVDWDFDKTDLIQVATGQGTDDPAVKLTKDAIEKQILREMARRIYLMTEGRHRVGTVYVYKNGQFGQNVDIQIVNKIGRSNADVAYWQVTGGSSSNYLAEYVDKYENGKVVIGPDGKPVQVAQPANLASLGTVIAHEMGHYIYGFMDEYVETSGTFDDRDGSWPRSKDNARSTIMNDSSAFTRLSVANDYPANKQKSYNQTAQARVYYTDANSLSGGSQWEMLTRDPANDSEEAKKQHGGNRKWFGAFKKYEAPQSLSQLTKFFGVYCPSQEDPKDISDQCKDETYSNPGYQGTPKEYRIADEKSYDSKKYEKSGGTCNPDDVCVDATDGQAGSAFEDFEVVFVGSKNATAQRDVLMSDRPVQRDVLMIDRSMPQASFKEAIQAAIQFIGATSDSSQYLGIVVSPKVGNEPLAEMQSVVANSSSLINALKSLERTDGAFDIVAAYNQASSIIGSERTDEDSATISLMTSFTNGVIPPDQGMKARNDRTAFDVYYFPVNNSQAAGSLLKLAKDSGGESYTIKNAQEAAKAMMLQSDVDEGMRVSLLATDNFEPGIANNRDSVAFNVSRYDETVVAEWYFDPTDKNSVNFRLQPPLGAAIMTLHEDSDLDAGYAKIEVINTDGSLSGGWSAEVFYTANLSDTVDVEISTASEVELTASMAGGEKSDPRQPVLRARFSGNSPITQAKVAADFFRAEGGREVLSGIVLKDDGQGVDAIANDGSYAADLSGMLPAGDFEVMLQAETTEDSMFEPNQRFVARGSTVPATPVGAGLKRVDSLSISLEAGAPGVLSTSGSGSGGGCTVANDQNDIGLVILLMVALLGLTLGRRRSI